MFEPNYRITAKALMSIEADRQILAMLPLTALTPGAIGSRMITSDL